MNYARVLTIAGSDPTGGAGIAADIKAISANGGYAAAAITAVVDEDTQRVYSMQAMPTDFVVAQVRTVINDIGVDAVKTGMLFSTEHIEAVANLMKEYEVKNLVVDPVMVATSGDTLTKDDIAEAMKKHLLPIARVITPNIPEAELLWRKPIKNVDDMKECATDLAELGCSVMLKGGHLTGDVMIDVFANAENRTVIELPSDKVQTNNTHGTGCTLSAAIATHLALGKTLTAAIVAGKEYITRAIAEGAAYTIGHGHGPVKHFFAQ
ncbi:MAG: bifunctional hydroxymethylpyrimidine kinase/phosphomethylpyrimidine kinase [Bacteroidales bacterium]|nr:bifunctional hydroxymethylpyrimidine kinase/phosphomethylpyrimidine kinase [Bacteroidales bacterium]